ncbi:hypothetical protein JYU34_016794 [Plutella xylostella]|uniref:Choline transporter-like protein n=1 Tax=Plutella xylostella TaxID=51655 RepID=A0ABQ7Q3H1_PLUXY|nr:hypothetical protein JYU34_016794 [Plutella xylostella]
MTAVRFKAVNLTGAVRFDSALTNHSSTISTSLGVTLTLFPGKCIVTAVTGIVGLLLLKRNSDLHFYAAPTLVICIYSFFIAHCMLSLYEMVVDTLFLCVCEDRNMNSEDGAWKNSRLAGLGSARPSPDDTADGNELNELQDKY